MIRVGRYDLVLRRVVAVESLVARGDNKPRRDVLIRKVHNRYGLSRLLVRCRIVFIKVGLTFAFTNRCTVCVLLLHLQVVLEELSLHHLLVVLIKAAEQVICGN